MISKFRESRSYRVRGWIGMAFTSLAACSSATGPRAEELRVLPLAAAVSPSESGNESSFSVPVRIDNQSSFTIYLNDAGGCGTHAEQLVGGSWQPLPFRSVACALVLPPPIVVSPGASYDLTVRVNSFAVFTKPGQYRVVLPLATEVRGRRTLVDETARVSSAFELMPPA